MNYKIIYLFILVLFIYSCNERTIYAGKIINQENLNNLNIENREEVINKFGVPSFVDPIENKLFYYTEKSIEKNFYQKNIEYSYLFVFTFDING